MRVPAAGGEGEHSGDCREPPQRRLHARRSRYRLAADVIGMEVRELTGRISNATWDRSVSSNYLYRAVSDRIIANLKLLGAERAQRRADSERDHS